MKKAEAKNLYSIRVEPSVMGAIRAAGIDWNSAVREYLQKLSKEKTCPTCHRKIK